MIILRVAVYDLEVGKFDLWYSGLVFFISRQNKKKKKRKKKGEAPVFGKERKRRRRSSEQGGGSQYPNPDTPHQKEREGARWCAIPPANGRPPPVLHGSRTQFSKGRAGREGERRGLRPCHVLPTHARRERGKEALVGGRRQPATHA